jgi:hypothetical protein
LFFTVDKGDSTYLSFPMGKDRLAASSICFKSSLNVVVTSS